ncbi:hypothetical protein [Peribacillus sp. YIM B13482]|uniref:hypothetical protein n=1 Tax=Peribacillus sp. YIM B13482 TaxID=3366298 RepID=UPI0036711C71
MKTATIKKLEALIKELDEYIKFVSTLEQMVQKKSRYVKDLAKMQKMLDEHKGSKEALQERAELLAELSQF